MKEILCFGDSNTWGWNPFSRERYSREVRWTGVLQESLGGGYHVIEEGQNGRTTVWEDPVEGHKNGLAYLVPCLESHAPLDLVLLMLGTNDLKMRFSLPACDIAQSAGRLIEAIQASAAGPAGSPPPALLIAPPPLGKQGELAEEFQDGVQKSRLFAGRYRSVAEERGCAFFDAGVVARTSDVDGVHLEPEAHRALGRALAAEVRRLLGEPGAGLPLTPASG